MSGLDLVQLPANIYLLWPYLNLSVHSLQLVDPNWFSSTQLVLVERLVLFYQPLLLAIIFIPSIFILFSQHINLLQL